MARLDEPNFLKAWREHRGLTRAELCNAARTTSAVAGLFEAGERGLSDARLGDLMPSDPSKG